MQNEATRTPQVLALPEGDWVEDERRRTEELETHLDPRIRKVLRGHGIYSLHALQEYTELDLLQFEGIGETSIRQIEKAMKKGGYELDPREGRSFPLWTRNDYSERTVIDNDLIYKLEINGIHTLLELACTTERHLRVHCIKIGEGTIKRLKAVLRQEGLYLDEE